MSIYSEWEDDLSDLFWDFEQPPEHVYYSDDPPDVDPYDPAFNHTFDNHEDKP